MSEMHKRCKIVWVSADQQYKVVCLDCGITLCEDIEQLPIFSAPGKCEPGDTLGINVTDNVTIGEELKFGG